MVRTIKHVGNDMRDGLDMVKSQIWKISPKENSIFCTPHRSNNYNYIEKNVVE